MHDFEDLVNEEEKDLGSEYGLLVYISRRKTEFFVGAPFRSRNKMTNVRL
jgi:hypothetical protein